MTTIAGATAIPPSELLAQLGIHLIEPLGGRLNRHWLVQSGHARLVLRRWSPEVTGIEYELRLLEHVAALGWPVAPALGEPIYKDGYHWSLFPFLPGEPPSIADAQAEQRARGQLLAEFHASLAQLPDLGQRPDWRRCEAILAGESLDVLLAAHEASRPEEIRILRWHLDRARERIAPLSPHGWPGTVVHGDFTPWNLRFQNGKLSGILDFELAHWDHRIADFALSWRGRYDEVIFGYHEVAPLTEPEWELLTPLWWAGLIECGCQMLRQHTWDDGWLIKKLLQRSPLMGADAGEFPRF